MSANKPVPGDDGGAAKWLTDQDGYENLPKVADNGPTALFWYVASLLAKYKVNNGSS